MFTTKLIYTQLAAIVCIVLINCFAPEAFAQQTTAQKIDKYIRQKLAASKIPGLAVAVVHYDSLIIAKGYGATPTGALIDANTPFALASLSKGFTATAVLQLVEEGKIGLDNPVIKYMPGWLPNVPQRGNITVRHLLNQVSGLGDTGYAEFTLDKQPTTLDAAIKNMDRANLISAPGKQFHYHNPNYQVLAKIVEAVSHEEFAKYLQEHIFNPLQMANTYDVANVDEFFRAPHNLPKGNLYLLGRPLAYTEPGWFIAGDAGIASTAKDMARWLSFQLKAHGADTGQVLKGGSLKIMQTPPRGGASTYAMGWHANTDAHILYHSGIMWTYSSQEILLTDKGYGIVVLINGGLNNLTDYYSFLQGIQDILNNKEPETGTFPRWLYTVLMIMALCIILFLGIRRLRRVRQWYQNYKSRAPWKTWLYTALRLGPFALLLLVPYLLTLISGRVLNWPRIMLMFPDVILVLGLLGILNLLIIAVRLLYLYRHKNRSISR
ncbi:serine hydrolase domain-containing protein [Mucilaginibacter sp.]|uniref:serine hydrolase domain-containing protein n=1 Tax=Mucilaginibacter sp. TaxID=1882438 RepID=UPI00326399B2